MDIEEFEEKFTPMGRRSRLEPFRVQIFELKMKGYADWQVRDWLATNGIETSRQAIQQFTKKGQEEKRIHTFRTPIQEISPEAAPQLKPKREAPAEYDLARKSLVEASRVKRERKAQQFIKDQPTNSLIKNLKDKQS